jgi:hypothetical protein
MDLLNEFVSSWNEDRELESLKDPHLHVQDVIFAEVPARSFAKVHHDAAGRELQPLIVSGHVCPTQSKRKDALRMHLDADV